MSSVMQFVEFRARVLTPIALTVFMAAFHFLGVIVSSLPFFFVIPRDFFFFF